MVANRNGFFYTLDRTTGELLVAKPYRHQWAREVGPDGPIVLNDGVIPPGGSEATRACPISAAARSSIRRLTTRRCSFLRHGRETCAYYTPEKMEVSVGGRVFMSGGMRKLPQPDYSALRAIDPKTGDIKWEHKFPTSSLAGVMSTASGVVFAGDNEGFFNAFDSKSGKRLWSYRTGSPIWGAAASTFMLDGRQLVLIESGNTMRRSRCLRNETPRTVDEAGGQ
jgi:alcohol dehydrogenase (cytochrome c)